MRIELVMGVGKVLVVGEWCVCTFTDTPLTSGSDNDLKGTTSLISCYHVAWYFKCLSRDVIKGGLLRENAIFGRKTI